MHRLPTKTLIVAAAGVSAFLSLLPLAGCGGGGSFHNSSAASRAKGVVAVSLKWPAATRVIPISSQSVKITLVRTPASVVPVPPQILTRPDPAQSVISTANFTNLEVGNYTVTVTAYPNPDGTGVAQATTTAQITVNPGNNTLTVTMDATVKRLAANLSNSTLSDIKVGVGQTRLLVATAYDNATPGQGNVVLTSRTYTPTGGGAPVTVQAITWTSSNPAVATVDPNTGVVTAVANGSATITAQYIEPGITPGQKGTPANIVATVKVTVVDVGLGLTIWPKFHGDAQNTGQSRLGATAAGTIAQTFQTGSNIEFSSPTISLDGKTLYVGALDNNLYAFDLTTGAVKWKFAAGGAIESAPAIGRDGTIYFGALDGKLYAVSDNGNGSVSQVFPPLTLGGPVYGSPTIDKRGVLYVATDAPDSKLYFVDSLTGTVLSNQSTGQTLIFAPTNGGFQCSPALNAAEDTVYVSSFSGEVFAVKTADASLAATFQSGSEFQYSSPVVANAGGIETVYAGALNGTLYALNASTLTERWNYQGGSPVYSTPAVSFNPNDTTKAATAVYLATYDVSTGQVNSRVFSLDPVTGAENPAWPLTQNGIRGGIQLPQGVTSSPAVSADGAVIYFGCYDGNIYGLNTTDGSARFKTLAPVGSNATFSAVTFDSSPAVASDGTVYIGGYDDGQVYAIK